MVVQAMAYSRYVSLAHGRLGRLVWFIEDGHNLRTRCM